MNKLVIAVLQSGNRAAVEALLEDEATIFRVDWHEDDSDIVEYCEGVLQTGSLKAAWEEGGELYITHAGNHVRVPLMNSDQDRHITLCALNRALSPDYEVRFCVDTNGSDTLGFLPLPASEWADLENQYGAAVSRHFYRLAARPNVFTDPLPF